jgi:hypothetical protein
MSLADPVHGPMPGRVLCKDCAHISGGTCIRPIGLHFDAGINGFRKRLHVSAALERGRLKTLAKRVCCGPDGQFFEPKGALDPILPVDAPRDDSEFDIPADPVASVLDTLRSNPPEVIAWAKRSASLGRDPTMTDEQIKHMVNRFLSWKLPADFAPDCGISFDRVSCKGTPHEFHYAPVGTNLLTASQAEAMIRHMLVGIPAGRAHDTIADSDGDDGA